MQEPDPWSKYSSRERNVIDTLAETETDTYMLIRSGGGGATIGSIDGYVFTTLATFWAPFLISEKQLIALVEV